MPISFAVDSITLDELATILLPLPLMSAIDQVDIEYLLWERRRSMNTDLQHAALPATSSADERVLPVVVLGDMVMTPLVPVVGLGDTVIPPRTAIPNRLIGIRPGRSYRAMHAALESDREVLVIFVPEREIRGYKSDEPQQLPTVGVIARLEEMVAQPDGTLEVVFDVTTRATVTARLQHDPFYRATCVPHPDPAVTSEIATLMAVVKAQGEVLASRLPYLTPEQIEAALTFMHQIEHPGQLADLLTYSPTFTFTDRIAILNTLDPLERLRIVQRILGAS